MRLFVALDLPWPVRVRLARLAVGMAGAHWVIPDHLHLTLRFIGEVTPDRAEEIDQALGALRSKPFALRLSGVGVSQRAGRTLSIWAGVARDGSLDQVTALAAKIETACQRIGLEPNRRRFVPHVTLARLERAGEERVVDFVQANNLLTLDAGLVERFTLFSARLRGKASAYTAEAEYSFGR